MNLKLEFFLSLLFAAGSSFILFCQPCSSEASKLSPKEEDAASDSALLSTAQMSSDLMLLSSIETRGWQGCTALCLNRAGDRVLDPEGRTVEELAGKPASVLLEYGLSHAIVREYKRDSRVCKLSLLRFKSSQGAYGAYSVLREGSSTVQARGQGSSETENSISFFSGSALVFLKVESQEDSEAKESLIRLADAITPRLSATLSTDKILSPLPRYARVHGSEKLFMGNKAASYYANFPFLESVPLDKVSLALSAEYSYARPMAERLRLLQLEFASEQEAKAAYDAYVAAIAGYVRKTIEKTDTEFLGKMQDSFLNCGLKAKRLYVIAGARKSSSPKMLSRELCR